jgi:hypothetical protein
VSTQINVTVDSGGLRQRARQLQAAARQGQLEQDRTQRTKAEAIAQQTAKRASEGQNAEGLALYGSPYKQPRVQRRPVETRQISQDILLAPIAAPLGTVPTGSLYTVNGLAASKLPTALRFNEKACTFYVSATSIGEPYQSIFSSFSPLPNNYSLQIPASKNLGIQTLGTDKGISTGGTRSFTLEAWLHLPSLPTIASSPSSFELGIAGNFLSIGVRRLCSIAIDLSDASASFPASPTVYWYGTRTDTSPSFFVEFYSIVNSDLVDGTNDTVVPIFNNWNHFAIIMKDSILYWFINGKIFRVVSGIDSTCSDNVYGSNPSIVGADFSPSFAPYSNLLLYVSGIAYDSAPLYFRGVRFTPKVRYGLTGFEPQHY